MGYPYPIFSYVLFWGPKIAQSRYYLETSDPKVGTTCSGDPGDCKPRNKSNSPTTAGKFTTAEETPGSRKESQFKIYSTL